MDNLGAILKAGGMDFDDVISVMVYLTDMTLFQRFNTVYTSYFKKPLPAAHFRRRGQTRGSEGTRRDHHDRQKAEEEVAPPIEPNDALGPFNVCRESTARKGAHTQLDARAPTALDYC